MSAVEFLKYTSKCHNQCDTDASGQHIVDLLKYITYYTSLREIWDAVSLLLKFVFIFTREGCSEKLIIDVLSELPEILEILGRHLFCDSRENMLVNNNFCVTYDKVTELDKQIH